MKWYYRISIAALGFLAGCSSPFERSDPRIYESSVVSWDVTRSEIVEDGLQSRPHIHTTATVVHYYTVQYEYTPISGRGDGDALAIITMVANQNRSWDVVNRFVDNAAFGSTVLQTIEIPAQETYIIQNVSIVVIDEFE